jgi:hypothetical protein
MVVAQSPLPIRIIQVTFPLALTHQPEAILLRMSRCVIFQMGRDRGIEEIYRLRPSRNSDEEEMMKKIGVLTLLMTATMVFTLAFSAAAAGPKTAPTPAATAPAPAPSASAPTPENHPHISAALEHMRAAKHELESAEHDFDGHRAKSLDHLNASIHEAEICMGMK